MIFLILSRDAGIGLVWISVCVCGVWTTFARSTSISAERPFCLPASLDHGRARSASRCQRQPGSATATDLWPDRYTDRQTKRGCCCRFGLTIVLGSLEAPSVGAAAETKEESRLRGGGRSRICVQPGHSGRRLALIDLRFSSSLLSQFAFSPLFPASSPSSPSDRLSASCTN